MTDFSLASGQTLYYLPRKPTIHPCPGMNRRDWRPYKQERLAFTREEIQKQCR